MSKAEVLAGIDAGAPVAGPTTVHVDVTNSCNAACVTCWDHSPLLSEPRPASWKKRRLSLEHFDEIVADLDALNSVRAVILSGMGEPLVHPDIYEMIARVKARGWELTVLTNLIAADIDRLVDSGVDHLLVGVHGATPATYAAFHPGWDETDFFAMCRYLRRLSSAGVRCRHVQVINRDTSPELAAMVRFGARFGAERVNFKLASLDAGTESCAATVAQRRWMLAEGIPAARAAAVELGTATNLDLFERQVAAAEGAPLATVPIDEIGCFMGYVYTRITVDREVLFCCNTEVRVGSLANQRLPELWYGGAWQRLRDRLRGGSYFHGCERCGKLEQNVTWSERYRAYAGDDRWRAAVGRDGERPRERVALRVIG